MFKTIRDGYGTGLLEAGEADDRVVVLTADLKDSTRCGAFADRFPKRFVQCGIAEQNMASVAAGLSLVGKKPVINSFAVFNPGRNWDQVRASICYMGADVVIAGHHSGLSAGEDGATHQALEDIAITRVLPNLVVLNPMDAEEARFSIRAACKYDGPVYLRLSKYAIETVSVERFKITSFEIGVGHVLKKGRDLTLAVSGPLTQSCLEAADLVSDECDVEVVSFSSIKPFDRNLLIDSAMKTGTVLTVEDHQIAGGFGSLVCEVLSEGFP